MKASRPALQQSAGATKHPLSAPEQGCDLCKTLHCQLSLHTQLLLGLVHVIYQGTTSKRHSSHNPSAAKKTQYPYKRPLAQLIRILIQEASQVNNGSSHNKSPLERDQPALGQILHFCFQGLEKKPNCTPEITPGARKCDASSRWTGSENPVNL